MLSGDEGIRRLRREHGFQLPLHPLQVSGWLTLIGLAAGTFLLLIPILPLHLQLAILASFSSLLLLHIAANLGASLLDPVEPALRKIPPAPIPEFDSSKHAHVIENGFCNLCCIQVSSSRTKHCSVCNKCVTLFDHHCKWLNHCIGGRNYAPFLMCISTAVAAAVLVAILAIAEIVLHHVDPSWLSKASLNESIISIQSSLPPANDAAFLIVVAALGILAAISAGLLLHLCFFHMYISFLGLTTYEYIRQQRQEQEPVRQIEAQPNSAHFCASIRHRPANLDYTNQTKTHITAVFTCSLLEKSCATCTEPTPTPPQTPEDCQNCNVLVKNASTLEPNPKPAMEQQAQRKFKQKWNCCASIPDSPEDPHSPTEPRCLTSLCKKYKVRTKNNKSIPTIEARSHRTHGHWSSAKIRVLFRVIGNLGHNRHRNQVASARSNQITPINTEPTQPPIQTISNIIPVPSYPRDAHERDGLTLPALPPPPRRRMVSDTELADALSILQQQQRSGGRRPLPQYRRRRRSTTHRPKTPTLSPIRESGLSNPASPSRQNCTVAVITGSCTRPF